MRKLNRMVVVLAILALLVATVGSSLASAEVMTIVKFEGEITAQAGDLWTIDGKEVEVTDETLIFPDAGEAVVGAQVTVVAKKMADESLVAVVIRVKGAPPEGARLHLAGYVDELDDDSMVVHGIEIGITTETEVEGELAIGAFVLVQAQMTAEGYVAERITVVDLAESPTFVIIGVLREMDGDTWQIGPHSVMVTEDTVITGEPVVGAWAKAKVIRQNSNLVALEIQIGPMADWEPEMGEFEGAIESFSPWIVGRWVVGGKAVYVSPMTRVKGAPEVGAMALVKHMSLPNGHLVAKEIIIENGEGQTHFIGEIESFPEGHIGMWQIEGRNVMVNPSTEIEGEPAIGALATVSGYFNAMDEVFMATRIAVWGGAGEPSEGAYYHVTGEIVELTDDYVRTGLLGFVNDDTFYLTEDTIIEGELAVGKLVAMRGIPQDETCNLFFESCDIDATDIYVYDDDMGGASTLAATARPATSSSLWARDR